MGIYLDSRGIGLKSLHESINTSSASGKFIFYVFGLMAEFEKDLIRERTKAGLKAARARGRLGGRPRILNETKKQMTINLYNENNLPIDQLCKDMGISKPTLYKYLREEKIRKKDL